MTAPAPAAQAGTLARLILRSDAALTGPLEIAVSGSSMIPVYQPGDIVTVARPNNGVYRPGDVVLFRTENALVLHRLLAVRGAYALTRGDARLAPDQPILVGAILGRVADAPARAWRGGTFAGLQRATSAFIVATFLRASPLTAARAADLAQRVERGAGFGPLRRLVRTCRALRYGRRS